MQTMRLTTKRQATLPKALCDELHVKPGDRLIVERRRIGKRAVWCISPVPRMEKPSWFGVFKEYARGKSHKMEDIRESIAAGIGREYAKEVEASLRPRKSIAAR